MQLNKTKDLFSLQIGDTVSKSNLFDLIQFSKDNTSTYWNGEESFIGNTPQQGINWIGIFPSINGVILKVRHGSYAKDGWVDNTKLEYRYSLKKRQGEIKFNEKANSVLLKQPQLLYPIFLFTESKNDWLFEGEFSVKIIEEDFVVLFRRDSQPEITLPEQDEFLFQEGNRRYVTHLLAERSKAVVNIAKNASSWICEICSLDFQKTYGEPYIEAHHTIPVYKYSESHSISPNDLALLCPNCHKAVHIYMKKSDLEYLEIVDILSKNF